MLLSEEEMEASIKIRKSTNDSEHTTAQLISMMKKTKNNIEFIENLRGEKK